MSKADTGLEMLVIKYSLGAAFLLLTLLFIGKIAALLITVVKLKVAALHTFIFGGDLLHYLTELLKGAWSGIWKGGAA